MSVSALSVSALHWRCPSVAMPCSNVTGRHGPQRDCPQWPRRLNGCDGTRSDYPEWTHKPLVVSSNLTSGTLLFVLS